MKFLSLKGSRFFEHSARAMTTQKNSQVRKSIDTLPPDILARVFLLLVAEPPSSYPGERFHTMNPLRLCAVSSGWRRIVRSTPSLWTSITLKFHEPSDDGSEVILFRDWIDRTQGLPLSLHLPGHIFQELNHNAINHAYYRDGPNSMYRLGEKLLYNIVQVLPRCERLSLHSDMEFNFPFINATEIATSFIEGMPILKELCLYGMHEAKYDLRACPNLNALVMASQPYCAVKLRESFQSLNHLDTMGNIQDLSMIFRQLPSLSRCDFHHTTARASFPLPTDFTLKSSSLSHLSIRCCILSAPLWDLLDLPSLKALDINAKDVEGGSQWSSIHRYFKRCRPSLKMLRLHCIQGLWEDNLVEILAGMPMLRTLSIEQYTGETFEVFGQVFMQALCHTDVHHRASLCPKLKHLHMGDERGFKLREVVPVVHARFPRYHCPSTTPEDGLTKANSVRNLETLEVRRCMFSLEALSTAAGMRESIARGLHVRIDDSLGGLYDFAENKFIFESW